MARNREPVKPLESQSESGEEENEDGSSEEVDSEPEQTQTPTQTQTQTQTPAQKKSQLAPSSSEEEESGSEFESESDAPARPLASKPMEENGSRKARPAKSAAAKRPAEDAAPTKDAKKSKKTAESEKKSNIFQRLWSEDDEIVILKGMLGYTAKYKSDPISDLNAFHEFIKSSLHIDFTRTQLQDKIRRLKKKYENNKSKEKEGKAFSKPHEQNAYDLSKLIWGNENGGAKVVGSAARKTASKKVNAAETPTPTEEVKDVKNVTGIEGEKSLAKRLNSNPVAATMEERVLMAGGEYFQSGQGLDGEQVWHKLRVEEMQLYQKQLEVRVAQTKLVLEVMKGRDH